MVTWDTDKMRDEANVWFGFRESLATAQTTAEQARFTLAQMGVAAPVHGAYERLVDHATTLLAGAVTEVGQIGKTLSVAADTYDDNEVKAAAYIKDAFDG